MLQKIKFRKLSLQGNPRICHPLSIFNNSEDFQSTSQKHLGLIPDNRLSFKEYLTVMEVQESKTIALLCKLQNISLKHFDYCLQNFYLSLSPLQRHFV